MSPAAARQEGGLLANNVVYFARVLRDAGMPIGPDKVIDALQALQAVGLERRDDFYYALSAVLVNRHDQQAIFDQAFDLFWRDPSRLRQVQPLQDVRRGVRVPQQAPAAVSPRVAHALWPNSPSAPRPGADALSPDIRFDAAMTISARERLQQRDFASMTPAELADTKRLISLLRIRLPEIASRRTRPAVTGSRVDLRGTLRRVLKSPDGFLELRHCMPRKRPATLVILCDISGSMESYTRMLLHFMHAVSNQDSRVHTFVFGTRLSHISRSLRNCDVDVALGQVARQVCDWAGGTRIGACLADFNLHWARRLVAQGAVVLLITDGLDSDDASGLGAQMQRLRLSCRQLVWLNPLLRYPDFEARPGGIRTMLPHVDRFLPVHNLASLAQLGKVLQAPKARQSRSGGRFSSLAGASHGNV
jgi:uncharacterized protein with von Willebrand factor type A (vWA) domain